jgi:hypothetical protein
MGIKNDNNAVLKYNEKIRQSREREEDCYKKIDIIDKFMIELDCELEVVDGSDEKKLLEICLDSKEALKRKQELINEADILSVFRRYSELSYSPNVEEVIQLNLSNIEKLQNDLKLFQKASELMAKAEARKFVDDLLLKDVISSISVTSSVGKKVNVYTKKESLL